MSFFKTRVLTYAAVIASMAFAAGQAGAADEDAAVNNSQATETSAKISDVAPKTVEKKEGEADVDEVITNRKLRAETGSKSLFSFSAALSYSGGSVNAPLSNVRPNIAASTYVPIDPSLSGTVGMKYKLSALQSLSADVGVSTYSPLHGGHGKSFVERTTVANPSLTYQVVYQAAGIQNVTAITGALTTNEKYRQIGDAGGIGFSQTAIYDFGGSNFSAGLAFDTGYTIFDKDSGTIETPNGPAAIRDMQADYYFGFYPFAEYVFTDSLNLRTVFRPFTFEHARWTPFGDVVRNLNTQSIGLGISVSRDIYLYPNVQFVFDDVRSERTNVGLSANINI